MLKDFPLEITPNAMVMIRQALKEDSEEKLRIGVLRIAIQGGGCSGLQYKLDIDDNTSDNDYVLEDGDATVVVIDGHSATVLSGSVLEYTSTLTSSGFKFINPKAKRTCGCGSSFGY